MMKKRGKKKNIKIKQSKYIVLILVVLLFLLTIFLIYSFNKKRLSFSPEDSICYNVLDYGIGRKEYLHCSLYMKSLVNLEQAFSAGGKDCSNFMCGLSVLALEQNTDGDLVGKQCVRDFDVNECIDYYKTGKKLNMFVSQSSVRGDRLLNKNVPYYPGADETCQKEVRLRIGYEPGSVYKAVIGYNSQGGRFVGNSNWVLNPFTDYVRMSDGKNIGRTNFKGWFVHDFYNFENTLEDTNNYIWTGLTKTGGVGSNCADWSDRNQEAYYSSSILKRPFFSPMSEECRSFYKVVCVEQYDEDESKKVIRTIEEFHQSVVDAMNLLALKNPPEQTLSPMANDLENFKENLIMDNYENNKDYNQLQGMLPPTCGLYGTRVTNCDSPTYTVYEHEFVPGPITVGNGYTITDLPSIKLVGKRYSDYTVVFFCYYSRFISVSNYPSGQEGVDWENVQSTEHFDDFFEDVRGFVRGSYQPPGCPLSGVDCSYRSVCAGNPNSGGCQPKEYIGQYRIASFLTQKENEFEDMKQQLSPDVINLGRHIQDYESIRRNYATLASQFCKDYGRNSFDGEFRPDPWVD